MDLTNRPPGWKSFGALQAERMGLLSTTAMAERLGVPRDFVKEYAPQCEWHHARVADHIGRIHYYDPRMVERWMSDRKGRTAWKAWCDKCVLEPVMKNEILAASQTNLVLCFAGVGSAGAKKNHNTSLIIAKGGKMLLVDVGRNIPDALYAKGMNTWDFDAYHITHSHADHIGGCEELLLMSRYVSKRKPEIIITENYQRELWEFSLKGGCEFNEGELLRFSDFMTPVRPSWIQERPREMYRYVWNGIELIIFRTIHVPGDVAVWERAYWSTGLLIDGRIVYSGDTRFDPTIFTDLAGLMKGPPQVIFHDCQLAGPGTVHATYNELCTLPTDIKHVTHLMHYGDQFESFKPKEDGFAGFAQPWKLYTY
jgi:glyoxylase-like metal-dependent hydrolase (beta-lactamase superfamily II)